MRYDFMATQSFCLILARFLQHFSFPYSPWKSSQKQIGLTMFSVLT